MKPLILSALLCCGAFGEIPEAPPVVQMFQEEMLAFHRPTWFGEYPGLPGAYMVLFQDGIIQLVDSTENGYKSSNFLQISVRRSHNEEGLLGIAFHPGFLENRKYYINYSHPDGPRNSQIEQRFAAEDFRHDAGEAVTVLAFEQPFGNHDGGNLEFGPDGYLYAGFGDGGDGTGGGDDVFKNSQNIETYLGAMLRIDVDNPSEGREYGIPVDNPFYGHENPEVKQEIWAYGLRNPWRFSFDRLTGDLWAGDVGELTREEVDIIEKGGNYGWRIMEGGVCRFDEDIGCGDPSLIPPLIDITRDECASVTGGYVYRGNTDSPYYGIYIYGDYVTNKLFAARMENGVLAEKKYWGKAPGPISTFGTDTEGNIYFGAFNNFIYKMDLGPTKPLYTRSVERESILQGIRIRRMVRDGAVEITSYRDDIVSVRVVRPNGAVLYSKDLPGGTEVVGLSERGGRFLVIVEAKGMSFTKTVVF